MNTEPQQPKTPQQQPPKSPQQPKQSKSDRLFRSAQILSSFATVVLIVLLVMSLMSPSSPMSPDFWSSTPAGECWMWFILTSLSGLALICSALMFCVAYISNSKRARARVATLMLSLICDLYLAYFSIMVAVALGGILIGDTATSNSSTW